MRILKMDIGLMEDFKQKRTWTTLAILIAVFLLGLQFALFAFGYMKANAVALDTVGFAAGAVLLIVASRKRKKMSTYAPQELMMRHCISYITMGAVAGLVVGFFAGTFLLSEFLMLLRSIGLSIVLTFEGYATVGLTAGTVIGGVAGYLLYRRSKYSKITTSTHVPNQTPHGAFKRGVLS